MIKSISEVVRVRIADFRGRGVYSDYADKHRCIFIHIPKAAGTTIAKTLFDIHSRHLSYKEYERANPRKFKRYFKFSFVRNPWDRLYSAYSFLKKGGMNEMDRQWAKDNLVNYSDFNSFVKNWVTRENIWKWVHFYPQYYFVCDDQMVVRMDFLGRLENFNSDILTIQKKLGLSVKIVSKINVTKKVSHYTDEYNKESIAIVDQIYAEDIKLFSYKFYDC